MIQQKIAYLEEQLLTPETRDYKSVLAWNEDAAAEIARDRSVYKRLAAKEPKTSRYRHAKEEREVQEKLKDQPKITSLFKVAPAEVQEAAEAVEAEDTSDEEEPVDVEDLKRWKPSAEELKELVKKLRGLQVEEALGRNVAVAKAVNKRHVWTEYESCAT